MIDIYHERGALPPWGVTAQRVVSTKPSREGGLHFMPDADSAKARVGQLLTGRRREGSCG